MLLAQAGRSPSRARGQGWTDRALVRGALRIARSNVRTPRARCRRQSRGWERDQRTGSGVRRRKARIVGLLLAKGARIISLPMEIRRCCSRQPLDRVPSWMSFLRRTRTSMHRTRSENSTDRRKPYWGLRNRSAPVWRQGQVLDCATTIGPRTLQKRVRCRRLRISCAAARPR